MKIFFGLGNPGADYAMTRHNAGFIFLDKLREHYNLPQFTQNKRFHADVTDGPHETYAKVILVKPFTFMNHSGDSVQRILSYYKLNMQDIVIIHDDLDIEIGKFKISTNMRAAGHNGIQNIIENLGTQEFTRIRIGVEAEGGRNNRGPITGEKYVLQKFSPDELQRLDDVIIEIIDALYTQKIFL
jgi:PTH1 family peptidyl-tRNA hydrolase